MVKITSKTSKRRKVVKSMISNKRSDFLYQTQNPYATLYYSDEQEIYNIKTRRK